MSKTTIVQRDSNIELLRLVLMLMVVLLHFNNDTMGGAFMYARNQPIDNFVLHFLESLGVCAVNCFMIVSGYFLYTNTKIKFGKVLDILLIVVFYRFVDYLCKVAFADETISIKTLIVCVLPANYFAVFYIVSYMLSPYISRVYRELSERKADFLIAIIFVLFILIPTFIDIANDLYFLKNPGFLSTISTAGNGDGYTIVQFIFCLSLGMWIRKREIQFNAYLLLIIYLISNLILTFGNAILPSLYNYCSVLTVINAVCLFMLFQKIYIQNTVINYVSKSCFAIFCIHTSGFANELWRQYFITEEHMTGGVFTTLVWTVISVVTMFMGCLLLSILMRFVFGQVKDLVCGKLPVVICE